MERRKVLLKKKKVDKLAKMISKDDKHINYTSLFNEICEAIANGFYDDKIGQKENSKIRVNVYKPYVEQARKKSKEKGYGTLSEFIEDVIDYETATNKGGGGNNQAH